jgi:ethanolamine ammonia-lyase small subunit
VPTLAPLLARLTAAGWSVTPVLVVPYARVKLQDEVGALLRSRLSLILLGERPGLGVPDSLGAYLTHGPGPDRTDADRNCVSNIRPEGLPPAAAAERLAGLLLTAARLGRSGTSLKEDAALAGDAELSPPAP